MNEEEMQRVGNLGNVRKSGGIGNAVKKAKAAADAIKAPYSLFKHIKLGNDWPYIPALFVAILKDLLDFVGIGSLPAIGSVVTIICSIFIFFMMLLAGGSKKRKAAKALLKGPMGRFLLLGAGTLAELLFGLNFLPIETAVVSGAYWMLLLERKESGDAGESNSEEEEEMEEAA